MTSSIFDRELANFQSKLDSEEGIEQAKVALKAAHDNEVGGLLLGLAVPAAKAFGTRAFKLGEDNLRSVIKGTKLEKVTSKLEELKARSEGRKPASEPTEETPEDTEETTGNFSGDNPAFDPDAAPEDDDVPEFEEDTPGDLGIELDDIPSAITSADASAGDLSGISDEALQGMLDVVNGRVGSINALTEQEFGFASQAREQAVQAGLAEDEEMAAANPLDVPAEISGGLRGDSTIARAVLSPEEAAEGLQETAGDFTGEISDGISAATEAADFTGEISDGISAATEGISTATEAASAGVSAGADAIAATGDTLLATGAALDATGVGAIAGTALAVAGAAVSIYEGFKDIFEKHDAAPPAPVSQAVFEPGAVSSLG